LVSNAQLAGGSAATKFHTASRPLRVTLVQVARAATPALKAAT
jgi:hypothetical protein